MTTSKRWTVPPVHPQTTSFAEALRVSPLVAHLLRQRGFSTIETAHAFLHPKMSGLHDPAQMPGMTRAAQRIVQALRNHEKIALYGDYDVDGVTASAILWHMFRVLVPDLKVIRYIPHRLEEGYGLNKEALQKLVYKDVKLIITIDCGITATEEAASIWGSGCDLIITDHHELAPELPQAFALVHPRIPTEHPPYPFGELCGAGVAWKLAWQVARTWSGSDKLPAQVKEMLLHLLPLAAMGTVADIVPLLDENRTIVRYGLANINKTPFEGLNTLIETSGLQKRQIEAAQIGFILGPRLNACGRLGHAKEALELLTTAVGERAQALSEHLNEVNQDRQRRQEEMSLQASEQILQNGYQHDDHRIIVLQSPDWHAGILGIAASRIVERYHKPTILLQQREDGFSTGSARSIENFDLHAALAHHAHFFEKYGGHAMAAGMTLKTSLFASFQESMLAFTSEVLTEEDLIPVLRLDAEVKLSTMNLATRHDLQGLAPFGRMNEEPRFLIRKVSLKGTPRIMKNKHLSFVVRHHQTEVRCVAWNKAEDWGGLTDGAVLDIACTLDENQFNGQTSPQLTILDLKVVS